MHNFFLLKFEWLLGSKRQIPYPCNLNDARPNTGGWCTSCQRDKTTIHTLLFALRPKTIILTDICCTRRPRLIAVLLIPSELTLADFFIFSTLHSNLITMKFNFSITFPTRRTDARTHGQSLPMHQGNSFY